MLNQGKTDELAAKADLLEDKLSKETKKNGNDIDGIKQIVKMLQDKVNQIDRGNNGTGIPSKHDV